ncbi:hypothetical protein EV401DRAFT_1934155 [Pisolithus croceorrhizus]|nr:hypothetical protein EV401DRAFT_1934155 [Pisolithus croceorrhizus]
MFSFSLSCFRQVIYSSSCAVFSPAVFYPLIVGPLLPRARFPKCEFPIALPFALSLLYLLSLLSLKAHISDEMISKRIPVQIRFFCELSCISMTKQGHHRTLEYHHSKRLEGQ